MQLQLVPQDLDVVLAMETVAEVEVIEAAVVDKVVEVQGEVIKEVATITEVVEVFEEEEDSEEEEMEDRTKEENQVLSTSSVTEIMLLPSVVI